MALAAILGACSVTQQVTVHDDHLEVTGHGAPRLNVLLSEVGLAEPEKISGVGGSTRLKSEWRLAA